jgi:hypothetical protein
MKKTAILIILILFFNELIFSQGVNSYWLFGYGGLTNYSDFSGTNIRFFNDSLHISRKNRKMHFESANASICNEQGDLKFYTNGLWIANALEDTMQNGSGLHRGIGGGLNTNPFPQAALIIPFPGDSNKYYIFHFWGDGTNQYTGFPLRAYYTTVDMSLNNGLGAVTAKNLIAINDTLSEFGMLTACRHANGRDWWVLAPKYNSNKYHLLLITPSGITTMPDQAVGIPPSGWYQGFSQSCFSPDGTKYARFDGIDHLHLYDFDRCSGTLSNNIHVSFPTDTFYAGGVSFSPNSSKVYISASDYLLQFDLTQSNIAASCDTVATYDGFWDTSQVFRTTFFLHQLGPDGKIYINTTNGTRYLHVINSPDSQGVACNIQQHSIRLKTFNDGALPNLPNYYLGADSGSLCDSLTAIKEQGSDILDLRLVVFPNPLKNGEEATFIFNNLKNYGGSLIITDELGIIRYQKKMSQWSSLYTLTLNNLKAGIYNAKLEYNNYRAYCKFVLVD